MIGLFLKNIFGVSPYTYLLQKYFKVGVKTRPNNIVKYFHFLVEKHDLPTIKIKHAYGSK
jgi:hypothetical protein